MTDETIARTSKPKVTLRSSLYGEFDLDELVDRLCHSHAPKPQQRDIYNAQIAILRLIEIMRAAPETGERRTQDEQTLRRLLAFAYSGSALYGDDGELQDGRHPMIDYVRDSVADIERKIHERGMAKLAAAACPECRYVIGHKAGCSSEKARGDVSAFEQTAPPLWDCACNLTSCPYCGPRLAQNGSEQA